jgi:hypothetical protein
VGVDAVNTEDAAATKSPHLFPCSVSFGWVVATHEAEMKMVAAAVASLRV